MTLAEEVDVAIIGAGPAGVTLAHLLGPSGLRVLLLEKDAEVFPLPRAIHFDGEVMRVFETLGLRAEVDAISRPGLQGMHFNNAAGETLLIRAGTSPDGPHGCANNHYFHQPELEAVLRQSLRRHANVELRTRHEVTAVDDRAGEAHATLQVTDLASGRAYAVQARQVVGCDGARSLARKVVQTEFDDLGLHQPWLVFDVRLKEPVATLAPYTVQHCDPARPMTLCNVTGNRRRWEIMLMPGDDPQQLVQPETIWRLIARWIRPDQAEIERSAIYTFHSVVARTWRRGRVLLAGDAAHQTPPFLGQGLCAAIRDVANLAWKLDAVLHGRAEDTLLDSYGSERAPHVFAFIELAVKLGDIIQTTDPAAAAERDARFKAGSPEIFHYPTPRLGPGLWRGQAESVARVFPQPRLADGRRLDAVVGYRFALLAAPALLAGADAALQRRWADAGVVRVPADGQAADALAATGHAAVLLRPDRYVAGVADSVHELAGLADLVDLALPVH